MTTVRALRVRVSSHPEGCLVSRHAVRSRGLLRLVDVTGNPSPEVDITALLNRASGGDAQALNAIFPAIYAELQRSAHRELGRWRPGDTLNTTALVHEAYFRLVDARRSDYADRQHFYAVAATAMRQIIVDHARQRRAGKRGGGQAAVSLDRMELAAPEVADEIVALDEALSSLGTDHPRLARVVELRYFAGLSVEESAEAMGLSPRTVKREWQKARAFLYRMLHGDAPTREE